MEREFRLDEELFLEAKEGVPRWRTHILGRKQREYIILDLDADHPIGSQLKDRNLVWVYCSQVPVCRFKTRIRHIFRDPPLLVLDYPYPEDIEGIEHRGHERKKVFIRVRCSLDRDHTKPLPVESYILNISKSGCLLFGDLTRQLDQSVFLSFRIPWAGEEIRTEAKVVRCESAEKGIQSGLKFVGLDPENTERLDQLLRLLEGIQLSLITGELEEGP